MQARVNHERTFGVELEFYALFDRHTLLSILQANSFRARTASYHDNGTTNMEICVKSDGSLNNPPQDFRRYGHEITFKATLQDLPKIKKLCELLTRMGALVNKSCGLHVHISVRDYRIEDFKSLYNLVYKYENVIGGLIPTSRLRSTYTRMRSQSERRLINRARSIQSLRELVHDRFYGLNINAYFKHSYKTVEFRYHSGTVDYDKILNWSLFCLRLVDHAKARACNSKTKLTSSAPNLRNLLIAIGLKPNSRIYTQIDREYVECRYYLVKRWHKFNQERRAILAQARAQRERRRLERERQGEQILNSL